MFDALSRGNFDTASIPEKMFFGMYVSGDENVVQIQRYYVWPDKRCYHAQSYEFILTNIFVCFHGGLLFDMFRKHCVYTQYVDSARHATDFFA